MGHVRRRRRGPGRLHGTPPPRAALKPQTADARTAATGPLAPAIEAYRRGDVETALALAGEQVALARPGEFSAHAVLGEVLHRAGRVDELIDFLDLADEFAADPRGRLLRARAERRSGQVEAAAERLRALCADAPGPVLTRIAGFELCGVLGQLGRHTEAWDAAAAAHAATTRPFPTDQLVGALRATAAAPAEVLAARPRAHQAVHGVACMVSLPRSGTTLLEQMLDRHPRIRGAGEQALPGRMADAIAQAGGGWPDGAMRVPRKTLDTLQQQYLAATRGALGLARDAWMLDKTLFPMAQPLVIGTVLPGAKVLRIVRDARDNATSLFTSNLDPSWGWTGSLASIREVLAAERECMPVILEKLQLDALSLRYEDLVEAPEDSLKKVVAHLGLDWDERMLAPHENQRLVYTLSHEQVRRPLNRDGMGRWQRHRERFGADWDGLV